MKEDILKELILAVQEGDNEKIDKLKYSYIFCSNNIFEIIGEFLFLHKILNVNFEIGYRIIPKGTKLFRIRRYKESIDFSKEIEWMPNPSKTENRANKNNEGALYLATAEDVCILETHIEKGQKYVLGTYEVKEDIKVGGFINSYLDIPCHNKLMVILNAFLISPARSDLNKRLFDYLDILYKEINENDLKDLNGLDLSFKMGTLMKKK